MVCSYELLQFKCAFTIYNGNDVKYLLGSHLNGLFWKAPFGSWMKELVHVTRAYTHTNTHQLISEMPWLAQRLGSSNPSPDYHRFPPGSPDSTPSKSMMNLCYPVPSGWPPKFCCPRHFCVALLGATFCLTYILDDFTSAALNLICLPKNHGDFFSPLFWVLTQANPRVPPCLPLPSHWLLSSLLIDQKPIGGRDLQPMDMQIPN